MHTELHWLDVPERVKYKLGVITRRCLYGSAPWYLAGCCVPVSTTASRQHLRSVAGHQLVIPSSVHSASEAFATMRYIN